jgi:hypothetical protein
MISIFIGYIIAKVSGVDPYPGEIPSSPLGIQEWH